MIACCIPIAIVLAAAGVVSYGFILAAVMCTLMMAMMGHGTSHGNNRDSARLSSLA